MLRILSHVYSVIGPTGIILVGLFFVLFYLFLRSNIYLYFVEKNFDKEFSLLQKNDINKADIQDTKNPLLGILRDLFDLYEKQACLNIKEEIQYFFYRNFEQINKNLSAIRLISVCSPLLGLLGTMLGMVSVFHTIAKEASPDSAMLASGIWEALTTTILGLCVAIPALAFYYHLRSKLRALHIKIVENAFHAIDLCYSCENRIQRRNDLDKVRSL